MGLDTGHPGNGSDERIRQIALLAQTTALTHQFVDALMATQCGLNRPLAWHVGAQAHVREHVQTLDVIFRGFFIARDHHPTRTVTTGAVALGQGVEGQRQHVGTQTANGSVLDIVVQHFVVDLIGEDDQIVFTGQVHYALQQSV